VGSIEIKYHLEKIELSFCEPTHPGIVAGYAYSFVEAQQIKITMTYGSLNPPEPVDTGFQQLELSAIETDISMVMDIEIAHFVEIVFDVRVVIIRPGGMIDFDDFRQHFRSESSSNDNPNNRLQKIPSSHRLPRAQWFKASFFSPDSLALHFGRNWKASPDIL
jgi:hypothetical protein